MCVAVLLIVSIALPALAKQTEQPAAATEREEATKQTRPPRQIETPKPQDDEATQVVAEQPSPTPPAVEAPETKQDSPAEAEPRPKQVIGAISSVEEANSDIRFVARVDTGATSCSMHVEEWNIEDAAESMRDNIGKTVRFRIKNRSGKSEWLEREIIDVSTIKTSERKEQRYKVYMTLECGEVKKKVLVSLNDRSHMAFPVLLGRNFLEGDFLVDVALGK